MKFEQFDPAWEANEPQMLPDGRHECEIVKTKEWRSSDIPPRSALILTLKPLDEAFSPVEKWLDPSRQDDHKAAMQLADALGIARDDELGENLLGGRVVIVCRRGVSKKTGEAQVYVNRFERSANPAAVPASEPKPAPRRTATKKADAVSAMPGDDIPF